MTAFIIPSVRKDLQRAEHPGKPRGTTAGSWIDDLAALSKPVMLCSFCERKWAPRKYGYERKWIYPGQNWAIGDCDGCQNKYTRLHLYMPNSTRPFH